MYKMTKDISNIIIILHGVIFIKNWKSFMKLKPLIKFQFYMMWQFIGENPTKTNIFYKRVS